MIWRGETAHQRMQRLTRWHRRFALLPTQMETGEWVWLSHFEARLLWGPLKHGWLFRLVGSDWQPPLEQRPPAGKSALPERRPRE